MKELEMLSRKIVFSFFLLAGCTTIETKYITVPVECPIKGVLPKIKKEELTCISKVTYDKLKDRENTILDYAIELEANAGCKKKPE